MAEPSPSQGDLGPLVDRLAAIERRLRDLERPTGTSKNLVLEEQRRLIEDLERRVDEAMAGRYTNAQIDAMIPTTDQIDQRIHAIVDSRLAGNVSIGGELRVEGIVTLPGARNTALGNAVSRVAAWLAGDGRLGHTS